MLIASDFVNDFPHSLVAVCQKLVSQWRGEYTIYLVKMELLLVRDWSVWNLKPCYWPPKWWYHIQVSIRVYAKGLIKIHCRFRIGSHTL